MRLASSQADKPRVISAASTAYTALAKGSMAQIPNPFINCRTLSDAEKTAGFSLKAPEAINECPLSLIQATENSLIQIIYGDGSDKILVRKASGAKDISGDYNVYSNIKTVNVKGSQVVMKGNGSRVFTATWGKKGYSYCISSKTGLSRNKISKLVKKIR